MWSVKILFPSVISMGLIIIVKRGLWITSVAARQNWIHKRSAGVAEYSVHGPGGAGEVNIFNRCPLYI